MKLQFALRKAKKKSVSTQIRPKKQKNFLNKCMAVPEPYHISQKLFLVKMNPSRSPNRHTFQKEKYIERCQKEGKEPSEDYMAMFDDIIDEEEKKFTDPASRENSMEWDLRTTDWILDKVRASESYAQNLYAAMCNNDFRKLAQHTHEDMVRALADNLPTWGCSWRYAGGIIADMRREGDYIDWYCSGIRDRDPPADEEEQKWTEEQKLKWETIYKNYVAESFVTDEIRQDLHKLGWEVLEDDSQ
jgi:hypothetical protein